MNENIEKIKKRIFEIVEVAKPYDIQSKIFDISILSLIFLNVIAVILGSIEILYTRYSFLFKKFEIFSVIIFTIEYFLRIFSCTLNPKFKAPFLGRIKFIFTPLLLIDLMAILPFYIPMLIPVDLRVLRVLRLLRISRIFKTWRYSKSLNLLGKVLKNKKDELLSTYFVIIILIVLLSFLLYHVERPAQPDKFSNIPKTMWYIVVTITTVGYGDMFPISPLGRIISVISMFLGLLIIALPVAIFTSGFVEEFKKTGKVVCPYCKKEIDKEL